MTRGYQQCSHCRRRRFPADPVLDVEKTGFSPGLRRIMAKSGAMVCFDKARDLIFDLGGIRVTDKDVARVAEAFGADIAQREDVEVSSVMAGAELVSEDAPEVLYIATDGTGGPWFCAASLYRDKTLGRRACQAGSGVGRWRALDLEYG